MTELECKKCGRPAILLPIGPKGFAACPSCDQVYRCVRCGQFGVFVGGWAPPDQPELATGVCSTCHMRDRANALPEVDVEAIREAARDGVLPAVKVARERLGWSINEAVSLIQVLGSGAEHMSPNQVNGMQLPPLLIELIAQGRWCHPGDESLKQLIPFLREPVVFLTTIESMQRESSGLSSVADDEEFVKVFHIGRGSKEIKPICLPWLDVERAVLISVNRFPGDDLAIALDYRTGIANPRVVASAWLPPSDWMIWREVAPTFTQFVRMLGLW